MTVLLELSLAAILLLTVGLAIVVSVYRLRNTVQVDQIDLMKG